MLLFKVITNCKALTHHCEPDARVGRSGPANCRHTHWHLVIYETVLGLLSSYLCSYICAHISQYSLQSMGFYMFVLNARTQIWKRAFGYSSSSDWNAVKVKR